MKHSMNRRTLLSLASGGAALAFLGAAGPSASRRALLRVDPAPRQTFSGFGVSHVRGDNAIISRLPDDVIERAIDAIYGQMPVDILHVWLNAPFAWSAERMLAGFRAQYVSRDIVRKTMIEGNRKLLLAPAQDHKGLSVPAADYAGRLVEVIARLVREDGVNIAFTGVSNEPNGFTDEQMVATVLAIRARLDAVGLQRVGIVAPESASVNVQALKMIAALKANPRAWHGVVGVATHSYNMATTPALADLVGSKPLWITEAGNMIAATPGFAESALGQMDAVTAAGRFLADMNNRATHWLWFVGVTASASPRWSRAGLVELDGKGAMTVYPRLYYLRELLRTFPKGSVFRRTTSETDKAMTWTYGPKPALTAAYAVGPDGTGRFAVVNATGLVASPIAHYAPRAQYECAAILPLRNTRMLAQVTGVDGRTRASAPVQVGSDGLCRIMIAPSELVTMCEV